MEETNPEIETKMNELKAKDNPSIIDAQKYVRYLINVKHYSPEEVLEDVQHWLLEIVEKAIKEVERENMKPKPKRYYVSLKEPLEDSMLK